MAGDRSSREEFERMRERHRAEIDRALAEVREKREAVETRMAKLRAEMAAAREKFERALKRGEGAFEAAREYREKFGGWPEMTRRNKRRRPRRGMEGGEPVPVEPKPKPNPLIDGAEAPIE